MKGTIHRILIPFLPLLSFSIIWMALVFAEVKFGVSTPKCDTSIFGSGAILLTAGAVWLLARWAFCPNGWRGELEVGLGSLAGSAVWLLFSMLIVIQFHVWLGGSL